MAEWHDSPINDQIVIRSLKSVNTRWFELGQRLGVKYGMLLEIKKIQGASAGELMIHMVESWFKSSTTCSWIDIIGGLEDIDENSLADQLRKKYLNKKQQSDLPEGSPSMTRRPSGLLQALPPADDTLEPVTDFDYNDLKSAYAYLLTRLRQYLATVDLEDVKFYLDEIFHEIDFTNCGSPDGLIKLIKTHIHVFKISPIVQIVAKFPNEEMCVVLETYQQRKERFLCNTLIADFSNTTPQMLDVSKEKYEVQFNVTEAIDSDKTLKDVDKCARHVFGQFYDHLSEMNKEPGSEFVVWSIRKTYVLEAIKLVQTKLVFLNEYGVTEISVGGIKVCSWSQLLVQKRLTTNHDPDFLEKEKTELHYLRAKQQFDDDLSCSIQRNNELEEELEKTKKAYDELQKAKQLSDEQVHHLTQQHQVTEEQQQLQMIDDSPLTVLGPMSIFQDSTGYPKYTQDPFCVSYRDLQHRAEDELAKFLYILLNYAWQKKTTAIFICECPKTRSSISTEVALQEGAAMDLRWQLKHLNMNKELFTEEMFQWRTGSRSRKQEAFFKNLWLIHEPAKYLWRREKDCEIILTSLTAMIKFADMIYNAMKNEIGPDLDVHRYNLREIRASYKHFKTYKATFDKNDEYFEKKGKRKREETANEVLVEIKKRSRSENYAKDKEKGKAEEAHKMVALQVASRFNMQLSDN